MNILRILKNFKSINKRTGRTKGNYYQDAISRVGNEQLKRLIRKGLNVPIALL